LASLAIAACSSDNDPTKAAATGGAKGTGTGGSTHHDGGVTDAGE
jgi:hypothetical protein